MINKRKGILLAMGLSFLLLAAEAVAAGQYRIISAQYGTRDRHIDVTEKLRAFAARNLRYRVDYRTFGDPAPGRPKALRIYARGPNGQQRMFEFRDGSVIDGSQFSNWGRGPWGGPNDRWNGQW